MLHNQTVHAPDPINDSSTATRGALFEVHWIYGTVISSLTGPIIIPLQRETRGAFSEVHWFYGTPYQYLLLTTFP